MKKLLLSLVGVIVIALGIVYVTNEKQAGSPPVVIESTPTDFAEIGTVTIDNPGATSSMPVLVYEKPGQPALTRALVFDALSFCMDENSAVGCLAMSQEFGDVFNEKRVLVEGIESDAGVLVRKIRTVREGETPIAQNPGSVYISWPQARTIIENCQATQVAQTHALDVYITLEDGRQVRAVEPSIDDVFDVLQSVEDTCPQIPVATE